MCMVSALKASAGREKSKGIPYHVTVVESVGVIAAQGHSRTTFGSAHCATRVNTKHLAILEGVM
jgi:hypothetical protein